MTRFGFRSWFACMAFLSGLSAAVGSAPVAETVVRKVAERFDQIAWPNEAWVRAAGGSRLVNDLPPGSPPGKSLEIEVRFSGKGFEWFGVAPAEGLIIPGDLKTVKLDYQLSDKRFPLIVKFKDGWGRSEVGSTKLEWSVPAKETGRWASATFAVPANWVRPITIAGLATHNWSAKDEAAKVRFRADHLTVETDLRDVDPGTGRLTTWKPDPQPKDPKAALAEPPATPLVRVEVGTERASNVFAGETPTALIRLRNWKPGTLTGTLNADLQDFAGRNVDRRQQPVSVESTAAVQLELKAERFGVYTLHVDVELSDGTRQAASLTCAKLPAQPQLSAEQKQRSPYGVNVNGGRSNLELEPFRQAGVVWFRDYAFSLEWLRRARGENRQYEGWPWFPAILQRYADADALVLPCLMRSIQPPTIKDGQPVGRIGPDRQWVRDVTDALLAFPQLTHWELDNEYDLDRGHSDAESVGDWANYRAYHRRFADLLDLLGGGALTAVEQGPAGIWPQRVAAFVRSGDFEKIGVVNSHHYCGSEPPERNMGNWNTGFAGDFRAQPPMLLADRLREVKRAAQLDGRPRQSWLTEFGWDNLAGPKVSAYQQAVYLARGWMLAMSAGTDKCFWFYDYDSPEPKQFFDGCGLFTADGSPKLALGALAAMTSLLPNPEYVGSISAGTGTAGCVFRQGEELVAALWSIDKDDGPTVGFRARELRDWLGNRLPDSSVQLSLAPVYAVGLDPEDVWFRQTAYELATPALLPVTAGDPVTPVIQIRNQRPTPLDCKLLLSVPASWKAPQTEFTARVAPGASHEVRLPFEVPLNQPMGIHDARITAVESGLEKEIPLRLLVQSGLVMEVGPLRGAPGPTSVRVKLSNRSARPVDATLRLRLPASWSTSQPTVPVASLQPQEIRELNCPLTWTTRWQPDESATVEFDAGGGQQIARPIIPGRLGLARVERITLDGRADDWPAASRVPAWVLGCTLGEADADTKVHLGWTADALYGLVEVPEAELQNPDPRNFWVGNCLELFLDTGDRKGERPFARGDHQFWFVPLVEEKRVYCGQWKRADEIPETRYDLRTVEGVAIRKGQGYAMEFRLPIAELQNFQPRPGARLGLNLNLTIKGGPYNRERYWPAPKETNIAAKPGLWGSLELRTPE